MSYYNSWFYQAHSIPPPALAPVEPLIAGQEGPEDHPPAHLPQILSIAIVSAILGSGPLVGLAPVEPFIAGQEGPEDHPPAHIPQVLSIATVSAIAGSGPLVDVVVVTIAPDIAGQESPEDHPPAHVPQVLSAATVSAIAGSGPLVSLAPVEPFIAGQEGPEDHPPAHEPQVLSTAIVTAIAGGGPLLVVTVVAPLLQDAADVMIPPAQVLVPPNVGDHSETPPFSVAVPIVYTSTGPVFLFTSAQWASTVEHRLETFFRATSGLAAVRLFDLTAVAFVTGSTEMTSSSQRTRRRTGPLALRTGREYRLQVGVAGGAAGAIIGATLIGLTPP